MIFTGVTWIDDDFENSIDYTVIIKNGERNVVKMAPHYQILFPVIDDDQEYNALKGRFKEHIEIYLNRLDIINMDTKIDDVFDYLNDKVDKDGFKSYCTITWENDERIFTATKRFTSLVVVGYAKKH